MRQRMKRMRDRSQLMMQQKILILICWIVTETFKTFQDSILNYQTIIRLLCKFGMNLTNI
ncbi:hypothetical protein T235_01335 [Tannerella sp. oral taxon BU063 isolate Cell 8/11]|uniref:Uncharacterized protein n=1 Tax=Tannerella sp. oral taxon BU063 isolate Cell 8/11 TaxID=1411915 RepID=W2D3R3_9BACT|nr:hypothetical protein T235_01335 [Tannerella sp. oral taxon BU063 isolate Cell 8/11]